ncbi:MAG: lipopolysaccharide biosynthesis protein [Lewinellaceae bacterium]|nr:lipopolysaccharide biosynthesis protein [Lewinellaceae bacterium]
MSIGGVSKKNLYEAVFTIGGRIVSVFIVLAAIKFLTNYLDKSQYGELALYNVMATLPSMFFFGPIGQAILRFYPIAVERNIFSNFYHQYLRIFRKRAILLIGFSLIPLLICLLCNETMWALACILIPLFSILASLNTYSYSLQNAARKRILALSLETGERTLQQLAGISLLIIISNDPIIIFAGYIIVSIIFYFINQHFFNKTFPESNIAHTGTPADIISSEMIAYSWPFAIFGALFWFQNASERWSLELFQSTEFVAQYAILTQIGFQSTSLVFTSINFFLSPILFKKAGGLKKEGQFEEANKINNMYLAFILITSLFISTFFYVFGNEIITLLSNESYTTSAYLLPLIAVSSGLFNFGQYYSNRFTLMLRTRLLMFPKGIASISGVVLNILFSYFWGITGLALSVFITQIIYLFFLQYFWKRKNNFLQ